MPPAISSRPSGSWAWPPQKKSSGVGIFWKTFSAGSHSTVSKVPASKFFSSLPEPATISTFPVCRSAAWMALVRYSFGMSTRSQEPYSALYFGWAILYAWYWSSAKESAAGALRPASTTTAPPPRSVFRIFFEGR
ncbi:hypothetical protein SCYAM73S_04556 [Streptomyces cyaneofuscatus]